MYVTGSFSTAIPDFNTFRRDMMLKWRYKYGDPEVRENLLKAQARHYDALTDIGIPSEAVYRLGMVSYYLQQAAREGIDQSLMSDLISALFPSSEEQGISTNMAIPDLQSGLKTNYLEELL